MGERTGGTADQYSLSTDQSIARVIGERTGGTYSLSTEQSAAPGEWWVEFQDEDGPPSQRNYQMLWGPLMASTAQTFLNSLNCSSKGSQAVLVGFLKASVPDL